MSVVSLFVPVCRLVQGAADVMQRLPLRWLTGRKDAYGVRPND